MDIVLDHVYKSFGEQAVLTDLCAVFPRGEVTAIMGPSGCGKTTLLRLLMGLEKPDRGAVSGVSALLSAVFQEDRLCPGFSAADNIRLVTGRTWSAGEIEAMLASLALSPEDKSVQDYSGGMKRRVAIARALLADYELLLLDEPFKGLDKDTLRTTAEVIRRHSEGKTVLLVTHEPEEAARMGARIFSLG